MRSAFATDILRSVHGSLGRFLAIMGIVALGCGFYAGLQMCGPDMRGDADRFYDGTNLWDVRLISTLGFGDEDLGRVAAIEGVEHVMGSLTCDAMARLGNEQVAVRISSLDPVLAGGSRAEGRFAVASDEPSYLNRPRLVEGRWPEGRGECVVSADVSRDDYGIGDGVELLYGATDLSDLLDVDELTIVGTVSSSNYPYTGSFGSTTLGAGMIDQYLYVAPTSLAEDAPYTEIYLTVADAVDELSESDAYEQVVGATKGRLEDLSASLSSARQKDLQAEAQATLDEKWDEYHDEKDRVERELADARRELDDAASQIADGEAELADGEARYTDGLATYEQQRASTIAQLDDAAAEIERNQATIDEGRAQLEAGDRELAAGEAELAASEGRLRDGQAQIDAAQSEIDKGAAELDAAQAQLDDSRTTAEAQLEEGAATWAAQRAPLAQASTDLGTCMAALQSVQDLAGSDAPPTPEQLDALRSQLGEGVAAAGSLSDSDLIGAEGRELAGQVEFLLAGVLAAVEGVPPDDGPALEALVAQLREGAAGSVGYVSAATQQVKDQVDAGIATGDATLAGQRDAARRQLEDAQAQIDAGRAELDAGRAELAARRKELEDGKAQLEAGRKRIDDGRAQSREARAQLDDGQRQLDEARAQLAEGRREAQRQLADAATQLANAYDQLEDARAQLADAREQYADGLAQYEDGRAEADESFADALAQLQDAQREIDEIELPDIYALDRTQSEGAATYHADAGRMDSIAAVFPFIFFLVAALVSLTTMTRMVEDDRVQIGTYKALGYSTTAIAAKYLAYAGVAGVVGATVGVLVLSQVLPFIVMSAYSIIYTVPMHPFPLPIDARIALSAGGLGVGVTLLATWGAVVSSLREVPAALMLPRAPKAGKRILLERIAPVWGRLSFTWKVTFRNLFRYKRRFLMTVIGISGCAALLLVGFGLHDSIWDIIDRQYGPIIHFDTTVGLDDNAMELDVRRVCRYLEDSGEVSGIVRVQQENMQAGVEGTNETMFVSVVIPRDDEAMARAITFRNRVSQRPLVMDGDAVLVTEKLALKYGLDVGDQIILYDQDDVGNAVGDGHPLTVTGVTENYVANLVYVGRDAWAAIDDGVPVYSTIYASTTADDDVRQRITDDLHDMEGVSTVIFSDETINMYRNMLSVVDMIVVVLIVSAAALAYIVLYNLTNINIGERIREIASLKVLGFTRQEVYSYIFREIALLAAMGDALGMAFGVLLERFVVTTAEVDYVMFGRSIHPPSFAYAFVLTMVFTGLVILTMRHKLDRVDMVESLKSVD